MLRWGFQQVTRLRLILSVDAILPPLTGIGRYAWELASRLPRHSSIDSVRFYSNGRWVADPSSLLQPVAVAAPSGRRKRIVIPRWYKNWQVTQDFRRRLFHSPNYFLPASTDMSVATVHDLSVFKFPESHPVARRRHFDRELPRTLARATHLITDSETVRREVIEYFSWPADRITAVPIGVSSCFNPHRSKPMLASTLAQYGLKPGDYALCVSTLEPRKKIDALLIAYRRLPESLRFRYPLVLIGHKGWLSDALHASIDKGQGEGWVRYLGFVSEPELPALYAGARSFFYPSLYEGFGLPVLEAMASGVPVLTSNRSCLPEVSGGAALLIDPDDGDALCHGVEQVLLDDGWRSAARTKGLDVASHLTWENCIKGTLSVYAALAVGRH